MNLIYNVLLTSSLILIPVFNSSPTVIMVNESSPKLPLEAPVVRQVDSKTPTTTQIALINQKAEEYNVSADLMTKIISCESNFIENVQSRHLYKDGTREQSYGLVQIHLPAHPYVTYEQAIDPEFAVDFLAKNLSQNKGSMWTCYRLLAGS